MLIQVFIEVMLRTHGGKDLLCQLWVEPLLGHAPEQLSMVALFFNLLISIHVTLRRNVNCLLKLIKIAKSVLTLQFSR